MVYVSLGYKYAYVLGWVTLPPYCSKYVVQMELN